jgi:hypothetical protein
MKSSTARTFLFFGAALVLAQLHARAVAEACGGPDMGEVEELEPLASTLEAIAQPGGIWAAWGAADRAELRFLHPFLLEHPIETKPLWDFAYDGRDEIAMPSAALLDGALAAGDVARAQAEARVLVDVWLEMPPVPAAEHTEVFWRAADALGSADASAAFRDIQRHFGERVPDGFGDAVRREVDPATFAALSREVDDWIAQNAGHPAIDLARLWKVRVHYFAGEDEAAWQVLFDLYPRRLTRVLAEMRYLLLQGRHPSERQIEALAAGPLLAALADDHTITRSRWPRWWRVAEQASGAAWGVNLEERLLLWAARHARTDGLPRGFPMNGPAPTELWAKLRAVAFADAGEPAKAAAQIDGLAPDFETARIAARFEVSRGRPDRAAEVKLVSARAREYLMRVLVEPQPLERLATHDGDAGMAARFELGVRLAARGEWRRAAARVEADQPDRATLWREAGDAAARNDADGRLAWARFLADHHGALFYDADPGFYRGLSLRAAQLGRTKEGRDIERTLLRSTERWLALEAFVAWLEAHENDPDARAVLDETDAVYNRLINWGGADDYFWGRHAARSPVVARLRAVGKRIRLRSP